MFAKDIASALALLRPNLFHFLVEEGICKAGQDASRHYFLCPNPNHKESTPSAHLMIGGEKGFCHGCETTFDLLTVNHWRHGAPLSGPAFIVNNVLPLCQKYDVPFTLGDLTEEEKFKIDSYRAHAVAADYIVSQLWPDSLREYVEARGLDLERCKALGIGVVPDYEKFEKLMKEHYTSVFLRDASFLRPGLFGPNNVIFTIKDSSGAPVGFISRDTKYDERVAAWQERNRAGAPPRKYDSSSEVNRIYFKREILFGFSDYLENRESPDDPLYAFEGQFDWATAVGNGLKSCCALGGKVLTPQQLALLRKHKVKKLVLVLDGDVKGQGAMRELFFGTKDVPGLLSSVDFLSVEIVTLPAEHDPSSFIAQNGMASFLELPRQDSFSWAIGCFDEDEDPLLVCEKMISFILSEPNRIQRERLVRILSETTGSSIMAIEREIDRREDASSLRLEKEKTAIAEEALREIVYGNGDSQVLRRAQERIEELDRSLVADPLSIDETITALDDQFQKEILLEGPAGFRFSRLTNLQSAWNGDLTGTVLAIGGVPNTGKSAMMSQVGMELVSCNDDVVCCMLTIDDSRAQMNRRFAVQFAIEEAIRIGSPLADTLTLNKMANPRFWVEQYPVENRDLLDLREFGYNKLRDYIKEGRLHIKDMTHGATILFLEKMVKRAVADYPGKRIVVILDNFHKAQDFGGQDERTATKRKSQLLKTNIAQGYGVTVVSTFEYKKIETGNRPTNNDLREAVNIEYDINYLEHLFNPLKAARDTGKEDQCLLWHGHPFNRMPIVEGSVGKNKINEFTYTHYYKFFPPQSRYECVTPEEAMSITDSNRLDIAREDGRSVAWDKGRKIDVPIRPEALFAPLEFDALLNA